MALQYSATISAATSGAFGSFGFCSNWVQLISDSTSQPVYFLASTSGAATTGDYVLKAGETLKLESLLRGGSVGISGVSLAASSGTQSVRVLAVAI